MNEIWKDIYFEENGVVYDYRGLYQVSNLGNIKSLIKVNHIIRKPIKHKDGYYRVQLYKNGKQKKFLIHRLVAHMFLSDYYFNGAEVNHKDEIHSNNCVENLEWCTAKYNSNYGTRNKRKSKTKSKKVIGYSLNETKIIILQSKDQGTKFGFNAGHISACCHGKEKQHKGYRWEYFNNKNDKED